MCGSQINLLVLDDVEHGLIEQGDETEAAKSKKLVVTKSNQPVFTKPNLLVLND